MVKRIIATLVFCFSALVSNCNKESSPTDVNDDKLVRFGAACSTIAIGSYPSHSSIVMDEHYFYFFDTCHIDYKFCRMDKNTGAIFSQTIELPVPPVKFFLSGNFFYFYDWRNPKDIYRLPKVGSNKAELIASLDMNFLQIYASDTRLYLISLNSGSGSREFFGYDLLSRSLNKISNNVDWSFSDGNNTYWITRDSLSISTIWTASLDSSIELAKIIGKLWDCKFKDGFIYFLDQNDNLMRVDVKSGASECIMSDPVLFDVYDDAYIIMEDVVYISNYKGELSGLSLKNQKDGLVLIDKKGSYDEDDIGSWISTDGNALYWIAGPESGVRISDEIWGTIFKTYVNKEKLFK